MTPIRYRLRTLVVFTAVGPPLIAGAYWTAQWVNANPIVVSISVFVAYVVAAMFGPIAWYHEIVRMICGPDPAQPRWRKSRRHVRVRIQRYAEGST